VHPEDRFVPGDNPDPNIVIVGIDDQSLKDIGRYPVPRDVYARALQILEKDGASVVAFDIGFPDQRDPATDGVFASALASSTIPVVLGYAGDNTMPGAGKVVQCSGKPGSSCPGVDEIPLRKFRCADASSTADTPCLQPYPNVILASTDIEPDADGVLRRIPMFVQPACLASGACSDPIINTLGFAAYRAWVIQGVSGPQLRESDGQATFGTTWKQPLQVDGAGSAARASTSQLSQSLVTTSTNSRAGFRECAKTSWKCLRASVRSTEWMQITGEMPCGKPGGREGPQGHCLRACQRRSPNLP